ISLQDLILYSSVFTEILPVIFYLVIYTKNKDEGLRVIFYLLVINFLTDVYGIYSLIIVRTNFVSFNLYVLIETCTLYIFFRSIISDNFIKKVLSYLLLLFIGFWIFMFVKGGQKEFLYNCSTAENIFILVCAIYYYYEKIFLLNQSFIYTNSRFWVVSAYFINASGTFFLVLYIPDLNAAKQLKYYVLYYMFLIIRSILLSIAMFMKNNDEQKQKFKITQSSYQ
ncbi:MAG: hypothetical protein M3040_08075, partial [Bacteroidota bacterium]|nr:hypothetical protein [Bacteroidota bacterium]